MDALNKPPHGANRPGLLQELHTHQIELEMQNEELRHSQLALAASQANYFELYELAPVGYCTINVAGLILEANLTATHLFGTVRSALVKRPFNKFVLKADQDNFYLFQRQTRLSSESQTCELQLVKADGSPFLARLEAIAIKNEDNEPVLRLVLSNITERKRAEDDVRIAAVAFASQNGMLITDAQGVILRVNPAFIRLTGYSAEEAIGQRMSLLKSGHQDQKFYKTMWEGLREKGYWTGVMWNKRKNGEIYAEMLNITAVSTPERGVTHYVGNFSDITQDKEAEAEIHRLAYYDALTKLPNRRLLYDRLGQALTTSARTGLFGAIFFIDVDHFKLLNDTYGHVAGDQLLFEMAQRLQATVREGDTVARQGGDEFVMLVEGISPEPDASAALAKQLGDKLRAAFDKPFILNGHDYQCQLSMGVSLFLGHCSVEDMIKQADLALYLAKKAGRNTLRFYDPAMQAALDLRSALEAELQQALPLNQLRLHYQPQVDVTRRMIGMEALLRWQHPQRGLVQPNNFIPLAEETGLILPIGQWVLQTACAQLASWAANAQTCRLKMAVNVSARQFRQPNFVAKVQAALEVSGANPALLKLELTESLVLDDVEDSIEKMLAIKQLGVRFSMDDFGTGYSSLSYLAQLPLDQLKIDQSFVRNLPGKARDETIVRAIITLGHGLAMNVIAEGVETQEQLDFLVAHGCQAFQGYLFARPLPIEALTYF